MVKDIGKSVSFYESVGFTLKNRWGDYYAPLTAPWNYYRSSPGQKR